MNPFDFRYLGKAGEYIKEFWGNEYTTSIAQVITCLMCGGGGYYESADLIVKRCEPCNGRGKIMASYI